MNVTEILPQDVWFAEFSYVDDPTRSKDRPVIVLDASENVTVLAMKVTSTEPRTEFEIELFDWQSIPLPHKSTADAAAVMAVPRNRFRRKIGRLSADDWQNVTDLYVSYLRSVGII